MNENKKNNYTAPAVKVVAFQVEHGFAGTVTAGDQYHTNDQGAPAPIFGTTEVRTDASTDSWGGSIINH